MVSIKMHIFNFKKGGPFCLWKLGKLSFLFEGYENNKISMSRFIKHKTYIMGF